MIKVVLADDHIIIRDGLKALLSHKPMIEIVAEAANYIELLGVLSHQPADIAIMDMNMPGMNAYESTIQIKESYPDTKIIILFMPGHESYINKMMDAGAMGYLLKNTGKNEFIHAIKTVVNGQPYISTEIALNLLRKLHTNPGKSIPSTEKVTSELSKREFEVLQLIAEGYTNAQIAEKLFTSKRTIESHRQNLLDKTNSNNTATLIKYAVSQGLIA